MVICVDKDKAWGVLDVYMHLLRIIIAMRRAPIAGLCALFVVSGCANPNGPSGYGYSGSAPVAGCTGGNNTLIGAGAGALGGALLGDVAGGRRGRTTRTLVGAVGGAAVGGLVGAASQPPCQVASQPGYPSGYGNPGPAYGNAGYPSGYGNPGYQGSGYGNPGYSSSGYQQGYGNPGSYSGYGNNYAQPMTPQQEYSRYGYQAY